VKRPRATIDTPRRPSVDLDEVRRANQIPGQVFEETLSVPIKPRRLVELMVEGGNASLERT
jgi:hypothetical protein